MRISSDFLFSFSGRVSAVAAPKGVKGGTPDLFPCNQPTHDFAMQVQISHAFSMHFEVTKICTILWNEAHTKSY